MKKLIFSGAATALVTPMNNDCSINYDKVKELVENQIDKNIDALVINGTTGESATVSDNEFEKILYYAIEQANGRVPVIAGVGSNNTAHSASLAKVAKKLGVDALLVVTPYYNKTSQNGLIKHYNYIADQTDLPIIVYNVPSRTGLNIKPETYKELAKHPNIVASKEANGDVSSLAKSIYLCEDELAFYSGNDDQIVPFLALGCKGVISVASNLFPEYVHNICKDFFDGNIELSRQKQIDILKLIELLFCDVNPIPIKEAMNILELNVGPVRLPLCELSDDKKILLKEELKKII